VQALDAEEDLPRSGSWFARAPMPVRKRRADPEIYEFCEVMP